MASYEPTRSEVEALIRAVIEGFRSPDEFGTYGGQFDAVPAAMTGQNYFLDRFAKTNVPAAFRGRLGASPAGFYPPGVDGAAEEYRAAITPTFLDLFWILALRGLLRPGTRAAGGNVSTYNGTIDGYSLTAAGRRWLAGEPESSVKVLADALMGS